ncbi:DUF3631 domain-containing protein [Streptomyces sp. NPDC048637]|uniref:DUF3631 domain-containing protein n=1 Tax=Streptomyces sp. NPDC048637 TaxID=3155636 RepID=UPI003440589A
MKQFPTLIDQVAAAVLAPAEVTENPQHRAILDAVVEIQELDRQLAEMATADLPAASATEQLDMLTDVLVERMAAGVELNALLSVSCCRTTACEPEPQDEYDLTEDEAPDFDPDIHEFDEFDDFEDFEGLEGLDDFDDLHEDACEEILSCPSRPKTIIHACLDAFDTLGAADYVSTAELASSLRELPGEAEGRWRYADLTAIRLALLLRPYGVQPRKPRAADGSRYRAYRRSDLLAARPNCSC